MLGMRQQAQLQIWLLRAMLAGAVAVLFSTSGCMCVLPLLCGCALALPIMLSLRSTVPG